MRASQVARTATGPASEAGSVTPAPPRLARLGFRSRPRGPGGGTLVLPAALLLLAVSIFPFLFTVALAFSRVSLIGGLTIDFGTLYNWGRLLNDPRHWNAVKVTFTLVGCAALLQYAIGMVLALILNNLRLRGVHAFRVLFIVPMALTPIAIGYMWRMMFHETYGAINGLLRFVGLPGLPWTSDGRLALASIVIVDVWHWTPFMVLMLLAGLQNLPAEVLEAARVDGATGWSGFWKVTFPMMLPTSLAALLLRVIEAAKLVDEIYIITGGGPGVATENLTLYAYYTGLRSFDLAYGATLAISLLVGVLVVVSVLLQLTRRLREVQLW